MLAIRVLAIGVALSLGSLTLAGADSFPEKPIKIIVPFKAGGGSDAVARTFQNAIEANNLSNVPIVVTNVAGPGGRIGSRTAKNAEADGYTILMNHMTLLTSEATGLADFGYRDFESIAGTGDVCMTVAVKEDSPHASLGDALAAAKKAPDTMTYGVNLGALNHMGGLLLQGTNAGSSFRFVQIGGDVANYTNVAGGHIDITAISAGQYNANKTGGGIRALAILTDERHPDLPDVPTAKELGFDLSFCFEYWWMAPKGTPADRVKKIADMLEAAMQTDEVKKAFANRLTLPVFRRGDELADYIASEYKKIEPIAAQAIQK
ncbi:MAG: Bug family tripartite tricarboxylate transporter substrate binding protein [Paracoccaceae bacterium]